MNPKIGSLVLAGVIVAECALSEGHVLVGTIQQPHIEPSIERTVILNVSSPSASGGKNVNISATDTTATSDSAEAFVIPAQPTHN
jgi:hypothetical protein